MTRREITVSTSVFAQIWSLRKDGEESEDEILKRILRAEPAPKESEESSEFEAENLDMRTSGSGFHDHRNGVSFPEGFRIWRIYKGKRYEAVASERHWVRTDTNKQYKSLNQLNASIAQGSENVWNGSWRFDPDDGGPDLSIDELRKISRNS